MRFQEDQCINFILLDGNVAYTPVPVRFNSSSRHHDLNSQPLNMVRSQRSRRVRSQSAPRRNISRIEARQSGTIVATVGSPSDINFTLNSLNMDTITFAGRPVRVESITVKCYCAGNTTDQGGLNACETQLLVPANASSSGRNSYSSYQGLTTSGAVTSLRLVPPTFSDFDNYSSAQVLAALRVKCLATTNTNFIYTAIVWLQYEPAYI
jgi:hypothetical protein